MNRQPPYWQREAQKLSERKLNLTPPQQEDHPVFPGLELLYETIVLMMVFIYLSPCFLLSGCMRMLGAAVSEGVASFRDAYLFVDEMVESLLRRPHAL